VETMFFIQTNSNLIMSIIKIYYDFISR